MVHYAPPCCAAGHLPLPCCGYTSTPRPSKASTQRRHGRECCRRQDRVIIVMISRGAATNGRACCTLARSPSRSRAYGAATAARAYGAATATRLRHAPPCSLSTNWRAAIHANTVAINNVPPSTRKCADACDYRGRACLWQPCVLHAGSTTAYIVNSTLLSFTRGSLGVIEIFARHFYRFSGCGAAPTC